MGSPDSTGEAHSDECAVLAKCPLFAGVDSSVLDAILAAATRRAWPAKAVLFRQGDPPEHLYLVTRGYVKLGRLMGRAIR